MEDKRAAGSPLNVQFTGELRENQQEAIKALLPYDCGILSAATAFGKTVVCSDLIAERKVSNIDPAGILRADRAMAEGVGKLFGNPGGTAGIRD